MKEYLKWRQKLTDYVTQLVHIQEQEAITIEDLERIDKTKELLRFITNSRKTPSFSYGDIRE